MENFVKEFLTPLYSLSSCKWSVLCLPLSRLWLANEFFTVSKNESKKCVMDIQCLCFFVLFYSYENGDVSVSETVEHRFSATKCKTIIIIHINDWMKSIKPIITS